MIGSDITIPNNTAATLTWTSSNATSCTASGSWSGSKAINTTASEGTGNLTTNIVPGYLYRLRCNGAAGTVPVSASVRVRVDAPISNPISSATCSPAGDSVTISWNAVPTAVFYPIRINDTIDPWGPGLGQGCAFSTSLNDTCLDTISSLSYTRPVVPGHTYQAWMHACRPGECSPGLRTVPFPFRCDAPPTATLWITPNLVNIHPSVGGGPATVTVSWTSTNATICTETAGAGFTTGGSTASSDPVPTPRNEGFYPYSISCTGPGGTVQASAQLGVRSDCNPDPTCGGKRSKTCTSEQCVDICGETYPGEKDCTFKEVKP